MATAVGLPNLARLALILHARGQLSPMWPKDQRIAVSYLQLWAVARNVSQYVRIFKVSANDAHSWQDQANFTKLPQVDVSLCQYFLYTMLLTSCAQIVSVRVAALVTLHLHSLVTMATSNSVQSGLQPPSSVVMLDDLDAIQPTRTIAQQPCPTPRTPLQSTPQPSFAAARPSDLAMAISADPDKATNSESKPSSVDPRFRELYEAARRNAPRCGDVVQEWLSIAEAARTLRMSKAVLSNWVSRGYVASIKTAGHNTHRLVHLDNILAFMQETILRDAPEAATLHKPVSTAQRQQLQP